MIVAAAGVLFPVAACALLLGRATAGRWKWLAILPIAAPLGIGVSSIPWAVLLALPVKTVAWLLALDAAFWTAITLLFWRFTKRRAPDPPEVLTSGHDTGMLPWFAAILLVAVAALAAVSFVAHTMVMPHGTWDAWAIWNLRARFLFRGFPSLWREAFSPVLAWSHPDYPLLVPMSVARAWTYLGHETVLVPIVWAAVFAVGIVAAVGWSVARVHGRSRGALAAAAILACPSFVRQAPAQWADVPLAFYVLMTFVCLSRAGEPGAPRLWLVISGASAGLAAWTKNEGLLFVAAFFACAAVRACRARGPGRLTYLWLMVGAAPFVAGVIAFKQVLLPPSELLAVASMRHVIAHLTDISRMELIVSALGRELWFGRATTIGVLPVVVLYLLVAGVRRAGVAVALGVATMLLMLAGYALIYAITPYELGWHLQTSVDRVVLHVFPTLVWCAIMAARRPGESWRTAHGAVLSEGASGEPRENAPAEATLRITCGHDRPAPAGAVQDARRTGEHEDRSGRNSRQVFANLTAKTPGWGRWWPDRAADPTP